MPATGGHEQPWYRTIRFSGFSLLMLAIIVLFVVVLAPSLRTLVQQQEQIAQQQREVAAQKADVAQKKQDVARWDDPRTSRRRPATGCSTSTRARRATS